MRRLARLRALLLRDGEVPPGMPLPAMVLRVLQQRDKARASLRRLKGWGETDCSDLTCEDE